VSNSVYPRHCLYEGTRDGGRQAYVRDSLHALYTPYLEIPGKILHFNEKWKTRKQAMKEHDIVPLHKAIISIVRQTPMRIMICPADETEVKSGKKILLDKLPEEVKPKVV
jgi:hypothetical protein